MGGKARLEGPVQGQAPPDEVNSETGEGERQAEQHATQSQSVRKPEVFGVEDSKGDEEVAKEHFDQGEEDGVEDADSGPAGQIERGPLLPGGNGPDGIRRKAQR